MYYEVVYPVHAVLYLCPVLYSCPVLEVHASQMSISGLCCLEKWKIKTEIGKGQIDV